MRAAIYTRVSTDIQATEGFSLEAQHDKLIDYVKTNGFELHRVYSDPGVSAKNLDRPGVKRMIDDLENGLFNAVIVHKLDRLTRNISDLYDLVELVNKHDVKLISYSENIDTSTPMGRMFVYLLGIFAQMFRENLADEVRKGMSKRAENGLRMVSVPMYGYTFDENYKLTIKPEEAKWVRWIFDHYLAGKGSTHLARELNDMGIRRSQGGLWDQHKIMNAIKNVHYTGSIHWKAADTPESERIIREGEHEAIIDQETFDKVQQIIKRRSEGTISKNSYDYAFGGILRCGKCGGNYIGKFNRRTGSDRIWRGYICSNNARYGTCDQSSISEIKLTALLFSIVDSKVGSQFLETFQVKNADETETLRDELLSLLSQSEARRERWQMAFGDGMMSQKDFYKRMESELEKTKEWESRLNAIPTVNKPKMTVDESYQALLALKEEWENLDLEVRKRVIQSLIQRMDIYKSEDTWEITNILPV